MGAHERPAAWWARPTWWAGVAERAVKTGAQTALAALGTVTLVEDVDWQAVLSMVVLAVLASVLTSMARPEETDTAVATGRPPAIEPRQEGPDAGVAD